MKFFACSYYTAVGVPDERFEEVIGTIRARLARYPHFVHIPVEVHEFGVLSEGGKLLAGDGTEFGGSWAAHMARKIYSLGVPRLYQWSWNTTKGGGLPIPVTHVFGMLEEMVGTQRLHIRTSRESPTDDIGCIAGRRGNAIGLVVYRHRAVRDDGQPVGVRVVLEGESLAGRTWRIASGHIIDRDHSGFIRAERADLENELAAMGRDASPLAAAIRVMARHRARYEQMSRLSPLKEYPELAPQNAGAFAFDLSLKGHAVIYLQLQAKGDIDIAR